VLAVNVVVLARGSQMSSGKNSVSLVVCSTSLKRSTGDPARAGAGRECVEAYNERSVDV
jgi:hypothetical protein